MSQELKLEDEAKPAYERDISPAAVDARMKEQIPVDTFFRPSNRPERRGTSKLGRTMTAGALTLAIGTGAVRMIGNSIDQNANEHYQLAHPKAAHVHSANKGH